MMFLVFEIFLPSKKSREIKANLQNWRVTPSEFCRRPNTLQNSKNVFCFLTFFSGQNCPNVGQILGLIEKGLGPENPNENFKAHPNLLICPKMIFLVF